MAKLLAVDDDPGILACYRVSFPEPDIELDTAVTGGEALEKIARSPPDVVLLDVNLPDLDGLETFRRLRARDARIPTIFVTGIGTTDTAIQAMTLGAYEYLTKPFRFDELRELVFRAFEASRRMRVEAFLAGDPRPAGPSDLLIGRCPAMQEVYKAIGRVAPHNVTALILGESGTGKELVARAVYHYSPRAAGPFLAINCAAIPETLLESELFGHEKGAFTGAVQRRVGKFEQCSGGTLFLDEVGHMAPLTQAKLLRVLQEQRFERVGGHETVQTDVRVIAATNRDLEQAVAAGEYRSDLFYRLNVYTIRLPPLRERGGDLEVLADHFLRRYARELGKEVSRLAPESLRLLRAYPWPGNVRELQSVIKYSLLQSTGPVLLPESLPLSVRSANLEGPQAAEVETQETSDWDRFIRGRLEAGSHDLYAEWQAQTDHRLLTEVLRHTGGNLSQAAKILGIHRGTLRTKVDALGIPVRNPSEVGEALR